MAAVGGGFKALSELCGGNVAELLLLRDAFGLVAAVALRLHSAQKPRSRQALSFSAIHARDLSAA